MEERKFTITLSLTDQQFSMLMTAVGNQSSYYAKSADKLKDGRLRELCVESLAVCNSLYQELEDVHMKGVLHELD